MTQFNDNPCYYSSIVLFLFRGTLRYSKQRLKSLAESRRRNLNRITSSEDQTKALQVQSMLLLANWSLHFYIDIELKDPLPCAREICHLWNQLKTHLLFWVQTTTAQPFENLGPFLPAKHFEHLPVRAACSLRPDFETVIHIWATVAEILSPSTMIGIVLNSFEIASDNTILVQFIAINYNLFASNP